MNKRFSTLMAGALLASVFATNVGAQTTPVTAATFDKDTYYLIGDGATTGFLKAAKYKPADTEFTVLAKDGIKQADWAVTTEADKQLAMWKMEAVVTNGAITGVKLKNKVTGAYLTLKDDAPIDLDAPGWSDADMIVNTFTWFSDANANGKFDASELNAAGIKMTINGVKLSTGPVTALAAVAGVTDVQLYAIDDVEMPIASMNAYLGNGFILNAKTANGSIIETEANGLFDKRLTAITIQLDNSAADITGVSADEKAVVNAVKKMLNNTGATDGKIDQASTESKTFFFLSDKGGLDIYAKATGGEYTITDLAGVKEITSLFKAATMVAVDKVKNESTSSTVKGYGYKYTTVTGDALLGADNTNKNIPVDNAWFAVKYNLQDGSAATVDKLIITTAAKFPGTDGKVNVSQEVRPQVSTIADKSYLITVNSDNTQVGTWARIGFGGSNEVDYSAFKGKAFSITVADKKNLGSAAAPKYLTGKTIHPEASKWDDAADFMAVRPEGQWVVTYNKDNKKYALNNRETAESIDLGTTKIYKVEGTEDQFYFTSGITVNTEKADTLTFTAQTLVPARLSGYANGANDEMFTRENLASTAYMLGVKNSPSDKPVFIQSSGVHNNTLTVNVKEDEGLAFYLVPQDTTAYGINESTKKYFEAIEANAVDSLRQIQYVLQERKTKRFVKFGDKGELILDNLLTEKTAQKFFLKEKEDGQYILSPNGDDKIYVNVGSGLLHNESDIYKKDIADEFGLYVSEQPKYADILKEVKADSDTTLVNINLTSVQNMVGNSAYMLTSDDANFLVEGVPSKGLKAQGGLEYDSVRFSILVDTAYVNRTGNTMPLYYLAMNGAERKVGSSKLHPEDTDANGHKIECTHIVNTDTVYGKYLFAMYDSIVYAADKNIKKEDYCYHYTNTEHFARMRFVDAKHIADTMIIASGVAPKDTLKPAVVTTTTPAFAQNEWMKGFAVSKDLQNSHFNYNELNNDNFGLFAFEINPDNNKEYAIYNPASGLYIAYLNGNVVLARQASYYTTTSSATGDVVANEGVEVSDVKVIAGNGNVQIANAQGKKVVISNILGQIIANTVITSDNAVIAAPQGVVVVAVEGEDAVKAIVK